MANSPQGEQIVTAAQAANARVAATPYRLGGKSEAAGLDCSNNGNATPRQSRKRT